MPMAPHAGGWDKNTIKMRHTHQTFLFRLIGCEWKHPDPRTAILRVNWNLIPV
jgi:hypothetical protein